MWFQRFPELEEDKIDSLCNRFKILKLVGFGCLHIKTVYI